MPVFTRRAGAEDLDLITPLFDGYRRFYGQAGDPDLARDFLSQRLSRNESTLFLAQDERGEALGFAQLYPSFSSVRAQRIFILNDLFVTPSARGRGVGRSLLQAAAVFGKSQNAVRLSLSTAIDNKTAQQLYEANGWKRDEVFCHYSLAL